MLLIDGLVSIMPVVGLYSQYALINERKHIGSFSIDTCGILIFANVLRIMFWFSKGFAINLLIQSFVVISMTVTVTITKFILLSLCIQVRYKTNNSLNDLTGEEEQGFWRWKSLGPFIICTVFFASFMAIMTAFFVYFQVKPYGEVVGLLAIGIQCFLGVPQLFSNQRAKSVQGLSILMIMIWFCGDFFKTLYFIVMVQPLQFIIGGAVQLSIDLLLVIQILAFRQNYQELPSAKQDFNIKDQIQTETTQYDSRLKSCDGI